MVKWLLYKSEYPRSEYIINSLRNTQLSAHLCHKFTIDELFVLFINSYNYFSCHFSEREGRRENSPKQNKSNKKPSGLRPESVPPFYTHIELLKYGILSQEIVAVQGQASWKLQGRVMTEYS